MNVMDPTTSVTSYQSTQHYIPENKDVIIPGGTHSKLPLKGETGKHINSIEMFRSPSKSALK